MVWFCTPTELGQDADRDFHPQKTTRSLKESRSSNKSAPCLQGYFCDDRLMTFGKLAMAGWLVLANPRRSFLLAQHFWRRPLLLAFRRFVPPPSPGTTGMWSSLFSPSTLVHLALHRCTLRWWGMNQLVWFCTPTELGQDADRDFHPPKNHAVTQGISIQ